MKITHGLSLFIFTLLTNSFITAQVFVSGQLNNSFIYSFVDSNTIDRLFTGVSAEIGNEGPQTNISLRTGLYIPRKYDNLLLVDGDLINIEQRISIFELGLYGKY